MEPLREPEGDPTRAVRWKVSERVGGWDVVGLGASGEYVYDCCHLHPSRVAGVACGKRTMPDARGPSR